VSSTKVSNAIAHAHPQVEGEVIDLPPLNREYDGKCYGGETRTLNLAAPQEPKPYQYPSTNSQEDDGIE